MQPATKGQSTRGRIIDAAIQVLAEHGFAGLTVKTVAQRAGIAYGNLTYHFPTRQAMVLAMLSALQTICRKELEDIITEAQARSTNGPGDLVEGVLELAMTSPTSKIVTELASISRQPDEFGSVARVIAKESTDALMNALGVDPDDGEYAALRARLKVIGALAVGAAAVVGQEPAASTCHRSFVAAASAFAVPLIEAAMPVDRMARPAA